VDPAHADGQSEYQAWRDEAADPPALVVQVGKSQLRYHVAALRRRPFRGVSPTEFSTSS
jgi:hypothetical protein